MIPALIALIVWLLVVGILVALLMWVNDQLIPEPIHRIIRVAIIVVACLVVVLLLLNLIGTGGVDLPRITS